MTEELPPCVRCGATPEEHAASMCSIALRESAGGGEGNTSPADSSSAR